MGEADQVHPLVWPQYVIDRVLAKRGRLDVFEHFDPKETALVVIDMLSAAVGLRRDAEHGEKFANMKRLLLGQRRRLQNTKKM